MESSSRCRKNGTISPQWPLMTPQPGVPVEGTRQQHAHDLDARFVVPAPCEHGQARAEFALEAAVVRRLHGGQRQAGVHVQRHLHSAEGRKDRLVTHIVQERVSGAAVDERALESELFTARSSSRAAAWAPATAAWQSPRNARMRRAVFGQLVVGRAVQRNGLRGSSIVGTRHRRAPHVDAGGIHVGQARSAYLQRFASGLVGRNDMRAARIGHVLAVHHAAAPVGKVRRLGAHQRLGGTTDGTVEHVLFDTDQFHAIPLKASAGLC